MATSKRDRIIVFRVSEQEYNCLRSACDAAGGHSLSEYTRSELLSGMHPGSSESLLLQRFREMEKKLTELQQLTAHMLECMLAAGLDGAS
ncbi:MAG: hypothetical protein JO340_08380 [Acidobacteriaceae bacterium]|nr:hypothetical protein [Acidobacteriaceae bacterium]